MIAAGGGYRRLLTNRQPLKDDGFIIGIVQTLNIKRPLFAKIEPLTRGDQNFHARRSLYQLRDQVHAIHQVLKVVQHEQKLAAVQVIVGHSRGETTLRYAQPMNAREARKALKLRYG